MNDNGGTLVRTTAYNADENISTRKVSMVIDNTGDASIKMSAENKALQSEEIEGVIFDSPEDQRKQYLRHVGYSDCIINSLQYQLSGDFFPVGTVDADLYVSAYASKSGSRIFIPIVMPDRKKSIPQNSSQRVNPVVVRNAYTDCDSIVISLPGGFDTEFIPEKQNLESKFGKYTLSVELIDNQLYCNRSFVLFAGRYNATEYPEFITYLKKIAKADQTKVVVTQKK